MLQTIKQSTVDKICSTIEEEQCTIVTACNLVGIQSGYLYAHINPLQKVQLQQAKVAIASGHAYY